MRSGTFYPKVASFLPYVYESFHEVGAKLLVKIWYRRGGTNTTVLFSSEGARTKEPLRGTTPSSTTANSTTTATTKHREDHNSLLLRSSSPFNDCPFHYNDPPIYIWMGVDGDFPQALSGYFLPSPWGTRYLQETPRAHTKAHQTVTWAGPLTQQVEFLVQCEHSLQ
jgi:hypothetical protein